MIWIALGAGSAFLLCGVGIAYAIGAGSVLAFILTDQHQFLAALPQRIFSQFDRFVLLSLPLFILTGEIMNRSGVTRALVDLSDAILGRTRGGLGNANILASVFFAGISGSAIADAATLSKTLVPEMEKRGYKHSYAAAITAASSVIGPIVPPSIILILYGAVTQTSVAALFAAGIVPGLLLAFSLGCLNAFIARRENHPTGHPVRVWPVFVQALPALTLPVIIVGGIVFGLMTPTEAASVAVVAAIGAGSIYGGVTYQVFWEAVQGTIRLTGSLFMLLAAVAVLGYFAGLMQWPQWIADGIAGAGFDALTYLLVITAVFLFAGMVLDLPAALFLLVPLLVPAALSQGVDPVHLGIVICFNLSIGLITPPLGGCLIVTSAAANVAYWTLARVVLPFVLVEVAVLFVLVLFPELSLFLPRLAGLTNG